jgi:Tol biopolymer transport system component
MEPGTAIAHYRITAKLGEGGMGEVWRATDTKLNREVAIKILPAAFAHDADRTARFTREAQLLASMNHPNIAAIYGVEERALIMELVEGEMPRGPLPVDTALNYARQIVDALEYAHERGVIHRDLKPTNIKVTPDGRLKVLDFGLAKALSSDSAAGNPESSPTLTMRATLAGVILGTAAYMSPEQARGQNVDRRADIWAFGAVLFEMLTGKQVFAAGDTVTDTIAAVITREPDWSALPADTPPHIGRLLARSLRKDPRIRLQAIGDARIALDEPDAGPEAAPVSLPPAPSRPGWLWIAATAVFFLGVSVLSFVHFRERPPETPVLRATLLPPEGATLEFVNGLGLPALSPDGRRIVFGSPSADGKNPLWVRPLDGLTAQPLAGTDGATFPFWSPDSRFIGFFADGKLKKIDASGGVAVSLADAPRARGGSWGREGVILFAPTGITGSSNGLARVPASGGNAVSMPKANGRIPFFLPDGRHFLYEKVHAEAVDVYVGDLNSGGTDVDAKPVLHANTNAMYAQGCLLFIREGALMAQPFDPRRLVLSGEAVPIAEDVDTVLNTGTVGVFSVSENGLAVFRRGSSRVRLRQIHAFDRTGNALGTVGDSDIYLDIALSPDGARLATNAVGRSATNQVGRSRFGSDIWIFDLARGASARFTSDPAADEYPVWSPNGARIVFASNRGSEYHDLYQKASSGGSPEELLFQSAEDKIPSDWSPDGRFLLYEALDIGGEFARLQIRILPMTGDDRKPRPYLQTEFHDYHARFSPDGRWVAYDSNESGRREVYVRPFPDAKAGKWIVSTGGGVLPHWRRDGRELYYVEGRKLMVVDVSADSRFKSGTPRVLFEIPDANLSSSFGSGSLPRMAGSSSSQVQSRVQGKMRS